MFVSKTEKAPTMAGAVLAEIAVLERASVDAFRRLAQELAFHRAPARLRARSLRAAGDEVRHARIVGRLAGAAGAQVPRVRVGRRSVRSIEAVALENAVEGCVRETFGAAVACIQGARAKDARVRAAMTGIARDEVEHAQLSWDLAQWFDARLSVAARGRMRQAQLRAIDALAADRSAEIDPGTRELLGLPTTQEGRAIVAALRSTLWA